MFEEANRQTEHVGADSGPQRGGVDQPMPPTEAVADDTANAAKLKNPFPNAIRKNIGDGGKSFALGLTVNAD